MTFSRIPPSGNAVSMGSLFTSGRGDFRGIFSHHCGFPGRDILYAGSGTAALYVALSGLKRLHPGRHEVVLPAWCCPSVPQAVLQASLKPVLVDLNPATFAYAPAALASAVSDRTLTVLLVHYFGIPHPKPELENPPPFFIRDCAQDFDFKNTEEADTAVFYSFGRGKSLNCGHGGALCLPENSALIPVCGKILETLPEPSLSPRVKALFINAFSHPLLFGIASSLPFLSVGKTIWEHPLRFTRIHPGFFAAAFASFAALEKYRDAYAAMVAAYIASLAEIPQVTLPFRNYGKEHLPVRFPLRVTNSALRKRLRDDLNRKFGGVTGQYPDILARLPGVPVEFPKEGFYPGAEKIAREVLTFPVTAWLEGREDAFLKECVTVLSV